MSNFSQIETWCIETWGNLTIYVGKKYIIDKEFNNGGIVELVEIYGKNFCKVKCLETNAEWQTSCSRLSEIKYRCIKPFESDYQFCIECDNEMPFVEWICVECGCFSPKGDPSDENIDEDGNEITPIGF